MNVQALRSRDQRIHAISESIAENLPRQAHCGAKLVPETPISLTASLSFRTSKVDRSIKLRLVCISCLTVVSSDDVPTLVALRGGKRRRQSHTSTEVWSGSGAEGVDIADREAKVQAAVRDVEVTEKPAYPLIGSTRQRRPKVPRWDH